MTTSQLLSVAMKAVEAGEQIAVKQFDYSMKPSFSFKKHREIVTRTDTAVNAALIKVLKKLTPDIPILSEEGGDIKQLDSHIERAWVIDPIDGTSNFTIRLPLWGISLGLIEHGESIVGVIALPALQHRYHAIKGKGAFFGKKRMHVSSTKNIKDASGLLCYGYTDIQRTDGLQSLHDFSLVSQTVRRLGAAVIEAIWIASGRADYSVLHGIHLWDVAAGALIVKEAGGLVLRPDGKEWTIDDEDIIFTTPGIAKQVLRILNDM